MTIYKIYQDPNIEAHSAKEASAILMEQNGSTVAAIYTAEESKAIEMFSRIKSDLLSPHPLGGGLYLFDGCLVEAAINCDDIDENTPIEDAYLTAPELDIIEEAIGE